MHTSPDPSPEAWIIASLLVPDFILIFLVNYSRDYLGWGLVFPGTLRSPHKCYPLLVAQNIDRQDARGGARGDQRGDDADGEGGGGDPHAVERAGLKGDVGHGVDLRIERDEV